jgi:PAS domain S-box-containing protein
MSIELSVNEYRLLVECAPVMLWRSGIDAKCDYVNDRWLAFTGRRLEDEVGDGWAENVHPEDVDPCIRTYLAHFARQQPFRMEYRLRRHDGVYRSIVDCGVPFTRDDGSFAGFIGSCVDVDDRRRDRSAREHFGAEPLAYTREFEHWVLAIVSHDIRSPLATIDTAAQLLTHRAGDAATVRDFAGRIARSAGRIMNIVADLLDLSRERHGGGIRIHRAPANLDEIVRQVADELATASGRRIDIEGDVAATGSWDAQRVAQAASNLLSNAIQHSPPDSAVFARVTVEDDRALVDVHNPGAIPTDVLPTIFEPFGASYAPRRRDQGLGLGLFIARAIARAHGGTVQADSSPERGTTFRLVLPR